MPKAVSSLELTLSSWSPQQTLTDWLYAELRGSILEGRLRPGTRLPASRDFARQHAIELVRRQYSGNAHGVVKGIGVVTCVYVNPDADQFWLIGYRIDDPEGDGKTKLDHVHEMLSNIVYEKQLAFQAVLMDAWYATKDLMLYIESLKKIYYRPLKDNRQVDDSQGVQADRRVDALSWSAAELEHGKRIKLKGFPKEHKVQCFRVAVQPTARITW
jgi:hypothetical protein